MKLLLYALQAPGTKTPQKRAWWASFWADQARKQAKSAPGGSSQKMAILPNIASKALYRITTGSATSTRYENTPKTYLVGLV